MELRLKAGRERSSPCDEPWSQIVMMRALGIGKATKGARWMPRHREAMKDVDSCEKLRGAANRR